MESIERNRRKVLRSTVLLLISIGLLLVVAMFASSLTPSTAAKSIALLTVELDSIPLDSYRSYIWCGRKIAIFRPGEKSINYLIELNAKAEGADYTRDTMPNIFVYEQISTYGRCSLLDTRQNEYFATKYLGWYDPCHMGAWDYSGRYLTDLNAPKGTHLANLTPITDYLWITTNKIELRPTSAVQMR